MKRNILNLRRGSILAVPNNMQIKRIMMRAMSATLLSTMFSYSCRVVT